MTEDRAEDDGDDDAAKVPPPTARRVAARAGVLVARAYRALLESEEKRRAQARKAHGHLLAWLRATEIAGELEPSEREAIETPLGELPERRGVDDSWSSEPAGVLAWALGLFDLPRYDRQLDGADIANAIDFLAEPWVLPEAALLRAEEEIESGWAVALTLHWRLRNQVHHPGPVDLVDFVARRTWAPLTVEGLEIRERDLVVRGRLVTEADPNVVHECLEIAQERHRAFEWLLGGNASLWSEVTTDT
jgi:hypothetical protein